MKLISIIVPVYKVEQYLEKCLDSIINQTYKNLEIILIDDGSPDNSGKICDDYAQKDSRIKVIHQQNGGVSKARNVGLDNASGDFIAFVDSDDYLEPTMYEKLINKQKENDADLVFCRYKLIKDKTYFVYENELQPFCFGRDKLLALFNHGVTTKKDNKMITSKNIMSVLWRTLYKKSALSNLKFDENVKYMEDVIFLTELILKPNLVFDLVDEYLYNYLVREDSACHYNVDWIIPNCKSYLTAVEKLLNKTQYEYLLNALKFFCYSECVISSIKANKKINIKDIEIWNTKENYRANKKLTFSFKDKLKYFLVHHKFNLILRILNKLR